jgi:hypothetical protein
MQIVRFSSHILMKLEFSRQILKNTQISNFMKIRPGTEAFNERDGRDEANSRFSEFCKRA